MRLALVGGLPGSGKTTVASRLATAYGWVHLSSDLTRKRLADVTPGERVPAAFLGGLYTPEMTTLTYATLLSDARALLVAGHSVVLDATWACAETRDLARSLAREACADLLELRCLAPPDLCDRRIRERPVAASARHLTSGAVSPCSPTRGRRPPPRRPPVRRSRLSGP